MSFFRDVVGLGRLKKHFGFSDDLSSIYKALIFSSIPVTPAPLRLLGIMGCGSFSWQAETQAS
jgi:hypothetical protein